MDDHPFMITNIPFRRYRKYWCWLYNVTDKLVLKLIYHVWISRHQILQKFLQTVRTLVQIIYQIGKPDFKPEFNLQGRCRLHFITLAKTRGHYRFQPSIIIISNFIFNERLLNNAVYDSVIVEAK